MDGQHAVSPRRDLRTQPDVPRLSHISRFYIRALEPRDCVLARVLVVDMVSTVLV